jgi:arabinan endo-1,5-alpha-L-arabinosidase
VYGGGATDGTNDVYAPGGQGVFYDPNEDSIVMYYHWVNTTIGTAGDQFQFGWNKLDFSSGWPVVEAW